MLLLKGNIDPLKDAKGDALLHDYGVKTMERWCEEHGVDWEENLEQRARKIQRVQQLEAQSGIRFEKEGAKAAMRAAETVGSGEEG